MGVNIVGQGDAGSPGSDGASPYLSRVFRLVLPCDVAPQESENDPIQRDSWGLTLQGGATREAGSDGASPYPSFALPEPIFLLVLPWDVIPQESENDPYQKDSWGVNIAGRGKAGSPGSDGASPYP
ncbi:MAG TPA: hypothetical protein VK775_20030 [Chthoniobacterales bacterium]|nr:hypothetical protein [Chthoniobacterales bacterium]